MAEKINLSSPPEVILKTLDEEYPKCLRWFVKHVGGEDKLEAAMRKDMTTCLKENADIVLSDVIDYNPPSGNHWVGFEYALPIKDTARFNRSREACLVWETEGYFGMFYRTGMAPDPYDTFIFTPHFFQRFCERMKVGRDGMNTLILFLTENHCYRMQRYEQDGEQCVYLRLNGCVGLGRVLSDKPFLAEIRTVVSDAMLTAKQLADTEQVRKEYDEFFASEFSVKEDERLDREDYLNFDEAKKQMESLLKVCLSMPPYNGKYDVEDANSICMYQYSTVLGVLRRVLKDETISFGYLKVDRFLVEQLLKVRGSRNRGKSEIEASMTDYAEMVVKVANHNNIEIELSLVQEDLMRFYSEHECKKYLKEQNKGNIMNQQSITMFKNLLSRTGLTKKFTKYASSIDDNSDRYMQNVESIYVISRFLPSIVDIKDRDKFTACNKQWMQLVVENGFCAQLRPYIEQYGRQLTADAICYLIDNNLWASPVDKKGLKVTQADTFQGLQDIPTAVDYLRSNAEETADKNTTTEDNPELTTQNSEPSAPSVPDFNADNLHDELSKARSAAQNIIDTMMQLTESARHIREYIDQDDVATLYEADNNQLRQLLREKDETHSREIRNLQKEIDEKVESIRVSQQKLHQEETARQDAVQRAYDKSQECKKALEDRDAMRSEVHRLQSELDTLREQARLADTPRQIIYRVSELEKLALVGQGVLSVLVPHLETKKGVIVIRDGKMWDDGVRYNKK